MTGHVFDAYKVDKDRAARERAEWRKLQPRHGCRVPEAPWKGGLARRKVRPITLAKVK
jgi:hypothetical protein